MLQEADLCGRCARDRSQGGRFYIISGVGSLSHLIVGERIKHHDEK